MKKTKKIISIFLALTLIFTTLSVNVFAVADEIAEEMNLTLTATNESPKPFETTKLTAVASGGSGSYQYLFKVHNQGTNGKDVIQNYSPNASCDWVGGTVDTRIITVVAKDKDGNTAQKEIAINVSESSMNISLEADNYSPAPFEEILLTTGVDEETENLLYKFSVYNLTTGGRTVLQDFAENNTCNWMGGTISKRVLTVEVKHEAGEIAKSTIFVDVKTSDIVTTLSASKQSPAPFENTTITANSTGGVGELKYKFSVHNFATGGRTLLQDYSSKNTYDWMGGTADVREITVDVIDTVGNSSQQTIEIDVFALPLTLDVSASNSKPFPYENIVVTANAGGGIGQHEYKFTVHNLATDGRTVIQDFSTKNTCDWMGGTVDTREITVEVRDITGKTVSEIVSIDVIARALSVSVSATSTAPAPFQEIELTAIAGGGAGDVQYKFTVHNLATDGTTVLQDYSSKNTCKWMGGTEDMREITVDVKDKKGAVASSKININVEKHGLSVSLSTDNSSPEVFETINLTATATGKNTPYEYKFSVHNLMTGGKTVFQDFSPNNSATWVGGTVAVREITVEVRDSVGNIETSTIPVRVISSRLYGIDVSKHNGNINWTTVVQQSEVQFAMLRTGYGKDDGVDEKFEYNYANARANGLLVGAYHYSYATSVEEAKREADLCLSILNGRHVDLPVAFDIENEKNQGTIAPEIQTAMVNAFCEKIAAAGYTPMLYSYYLWLVNKINLEDVNDNVLLWEANWKGSPQLYGNTIHMWQKSGDGEGDQNTSIPGIPSKTVDINYFYIDGLFLENPDSDADGNAICTSASSLNIRSGPSTSYKVLGSIPSGARFTVTGSLNNGFYPVSYKGINGYSSAQYIVHPA